MRMISNGYAQQSLPVGTPCKTRRWESLLLSDCHWIMMLHQRGSFSCGLLRELDPA